MSFVFPSDEWIKAYKEAIDANEAYKEAGKTWTHGVVALICLDNVAGGIDGIGFVHIMVMAQDRHIIMQ